MNSVTVIFKAVEEIKTLFRVSDGVDFTLSP